MHTSITNYTLYIHQFKCFLYAKNHRDKKMHFVHKKDIKCVFIPNVLNECGIAMLIIYIPYHIIFSSSQGKIYSVASFDAFFSNVLWCRIYLYHRWGMYYTGSLETYLIIDSSCPSAFLTHISCFHSGTIHMHSDRKLNYILFHLIIFLWIKDKYFGHCVSLSVEPLYLHIAARSDYWFFIVLQWVLLLLPEI